MMGSRLIARIGALMPGDTDPRFKDMPASARAVLLYMAGVTLDVDSDSTPAGHYYGGWDRLARTLGHPNADHNTAGERAVARALRELRERGIVRRVGSTEEQRRWSTYVYLIDV